MTKGLRYCTDDDQLPLYCWCNVHYTFGNFQYHNFQNYQGNFGIFSTVFCLYNTIHIIRDLLLSHFASPIHTIWASTQHEQNILLWSTERCITVAPCEGYGVLNHWPIDCWFNSLSEITTQKTSNVVCVVSLNKLLNQLSRWPRLHIPGYFSGEYIGGFPFKKANNVESVSMPWRYMIFPLWGRYPTRHQISARF